MDEDCEAYGHDDQVTYEDEEIIEYECRRCGAELQPIWKEIS